MDGQTIFAILIGAALGCFSLVMVGYSFFRGNEPARGTSGLSSSQSDEGVGLDAIYDSIDTLELEYQLGNIPEVQYQEQLESYRLQAAVAIKALLDSGDAPPELMLEQEILRARSAKDSTQPPGDWRPCPRCDAPLPEPADGSISGQSCPHCGTPLVAEAPVAGESDRNAEGQTQAEVR